MTLKMYQIIEFPEFFEKIKTEKLPFKISYKFTLLAQEIEKHMTFYYEKLREIVMQYGEKNEEGELVPTDDGEGIKLIADTINEANARVAELRNLEVELPDIKFNIEMLEDLKLSLLEMNVLLPFVEE